MKKTTLTLLACCLTSSVLAEDVQVPDFQLCLDMICTDCDTPLTERQIRLNYDMTSETIMGVMQGVDADGEWGQPLIGKLENGRVFFARPRSGANELMFFDLDLSTLTGTRFRTQYNFRGGVAYQEKSPISVSLQLAACPLPAVDGV
jgi:hypothetical protein